MSFSKQIICFYLFLIGFKLIETSDVSEDEDNKETTKNLVKSKAGLEFDVDEEEDADTRRHRRTWEGRPGGPLPPLEKLISLAGQVWELGNTEMGAWQNRIVKTGKTVLEK